MFASTVIGPAPLPSPQVLAGASRHAHEHGPRSEAPQAARPDATQPHSDARDTTADSRTRVTPGDQASRPDGETLTETQLRQLERMKDTDREVRQHELAHQAAGGAHTGSPSYDFERGPDGQRYAVAGQVPIDYGPVPGDPRATIDKMQQVVSAALAPADPSSKDHQVAAKARQYLLTAQLELTQQQSEMDGARRDARGPDASSQQTEGQSSDASGAVDADRVAQRDAPAAQLSQYDIIAQGAASGGGEHLLGLA